MPDIRIPGGVLTVAGNYKPGDPAPTGYLAWHEWAHIQHKAGLRQKQCAKCGKWKYPQELSSKVFQYAASVMGGCLMVSGSLCIECEAAHA